jgi:hypothetical protein
MNSKQRKSQSFQVGLLAEHAEGNEAGTVLPYAFLRSTPPRGTTHTR